jgi:hypothetical protein
VEKVQEESEIIHPVNKYRLTFRKGQTAIGVVKKSDPQDLQNQADNHPRDQQAADGLFELQ